MFLRLFKIESYTYSIENYGAEHYKLKPYPLVHYRVSSSDVWPKSIVEERLKCGLWQEINALGDKRIKRMCL